MKKKRIYIDNCIISAFLNANERPDHVIDFFDYCKTKNIQLVASQTIYREAIRLKNKAGEFLSIDETRIQTRKFIDENILLLPYFKDIGLLTQELVWETNCASSDAEHIASCIIHRINTLCTSDKKMLQLNEQINNMSINNNKISVNIQNTDAFKTEQKSLI